MKIVAQITITCQSLNELANLDEFQNMTTKKHRPNDPVYEVTSS